MFANMVSIRFDVSFVITCALILFCFAIASNSCQLLNVATEYKFVKVTNERIRSRHFSIVFSIECVICKLTSFESLLLATKRQHTIHRNAEPYTNGKEIITIIAIADNS